MTKTLNVTITVNDERQEVHALASSPCGAWNEEDKWTPEMDYVLGMALSRVTKKIAADFAKVDEETKEKYAFYQFITRA